MNQFNLQAWFVRCLLGLALLVLVGCEPLPGQPPTSAQYVAPEKVVAFDKLYATNCSACHGKEGKLGAAPPLNDPLFLRIVPDAELHRVITEGRLATKDRPATPMAAFAQEKGGTLTKEQVKILADGIKQKWQSAASAGDAPAYLAPDYFGNPILGEQIFERACASCHGEKGRTVKVRGKKDLTINDRAFLSLISDQALRRIIITGRPDLGMPDYADKTGREDDYRPLTSEEISDLVALLGDWRKGESK